MASFTQPRTYMLGGTVVDPDALACYLHDTGNQDFLESVRAARAQGLSDAEILSSFYAKLCYASLTLGKNANVTRIRDIPSNLVACFDAGHGSVFGHCMLNFVTTDCSRVLTHELVRNHIGTEFSQTSGRYVRGDTIKLIFDKILKPVDAHIMAFLNVTEDVYRTLCDRMGLNGREGIRRGLVQEIVVKDHVEKVPPTEEQVEEYIKLVLGGRDVDNLDFNHKKKVTSALRRILPNGQSNEIGWSINLRALRHVIQMRTGRHAEWEIRLVFNQVYNLVKAKYPMIFYGATETEVDGLLEISDLKTQPYQKTREELLKELSIEQLQAELERRKLS